MKTNLIIGLIFLSINIHAEQETQTAEMMKNFGQAMYLDVETNNSSIVAVGERGHVAISTDYGTTWEQSKNVPTRITLTAVSIFNKHIWAVGHDTTIIYSSDSGKTWETQFIDIERQMPLLDVLFINESDGYAVGAYGTYLTTHDGGKNWDDNLISEEQDYHLNKIIKVDEFKMFVVAEAGFAYRSFDAGKNWESLELPYPGSMFGVAYFKQQLVAYGLRGNVLVSDDFGENFMQIESPVLDSLFGSAHTYNNKLLLVGANGAVLEYKNNSLSKIEIPDSDGDYSELLSIKDGQVVFVGESGISTKKVR